MGSWAVQHQARHQWRQLCGHWLRTGLEMFQGFQAASGESSAWLLWGHQNTNLALTAIPGKADWCLASQACWEHEVNLFPNRVQTAWGVVSWWTSAAMMYSLQFSTTLINPCETSCLKEEGSGGQLGSVLKAWAEGTEWIEKASVQRLPCSHCSLGKRDAMSAHPSEACS